MEIHSTLTHIPRHPTSSNFTTSWRWSCELLWWEISLYFSCDHTLHYSDALGQIQTTPNCRSQSLKVTSSQYDRSREAQTSKLAMVMWANLVRISFNFSCNYTLHALRALWQTPRQPRDADPDQIGWNYQLAVWWGIQKLNFFWKIQMIRNWEAATPKPIQRFSFAICIAAKFLLLIELIQHGLAWSSAWIF